jgi:hypothetical protein
MFNQLTPAEVVGAIGTTVRTAARSDGPTSDFDRDQLMSAYSATRHLAVELSAYEPELSRFTEAVARSVRAAALPGALEIAAGLGDAGDPRVVGASLCELLDRLREERLPQAIALRGEIHARLRALADREVDLLADALG